MFRKLADNRNQSSFAVQFRRKRFLLFSSLLSRLDRPVEILDIGGTEEFWKMMGLNADDQVFVTLLNFTEENVTLPNVSSMVGDARSLIAENASFDVVFSNPVIEHVGAYADQMLMAKEVCGVGKRYFVQTPNRNFPLEPHFLFPFFQYLPLSIKILLRQNFNLGWFNKTQDAVQAREIVESIRLLNRREFALLFPGSIIYEERIFGLVKSFVAYGGWDA